MTDEVRLQDDAFSKGLETVTRLVRCKSFTTELGDKIREDGGAERAVSAMRREFSPKGALPDVAARFSTPVFYVQPEFEELKRRFPGYLDPDYKGTRFDPIDCCKNVCRKDRHVTFEYIHMGRLVSNNEALDEIKRRGLRPALYEELLSSSERYSPEQCTHRIVAPGSVAKVRGELRAAALSYSGPWRFLDLILADDGWEGRYWLLAVCEASS